MVTYRGIKLLAGDGRTREVIYWTKWLRHVSSIRRKFWQWSDDFDPFHFNEAASVAVLANAAAKGGYLAHTEYVALKRSATRGRPFRQGRCDLWIAYVRNEVSWAFEMKQHSAAPKIRQATFAKWLNDACKDAKDVHSDEADLRVGCLILIPKANALTDQDFVSHVDALCANADIAFRISGDLGPIWFAFKFVVD